MIPGIIYHYAHLWYGPIGTLVNAPILITSFICYAILFVYALRKKQQSKMEKLGGENV